MFVKMPKNPEMPVRKGEKGHGYKEKQRFRNICTTYGQNGYCLCENGQISDEFSFSKTVPKPVFSIPEAHLSAPFESGRSRDKSDLAIYTPENICYNQITVSG